MFSIALYGVFSCKDVLRKIELLPKRYFRAAAYFYEAEDYVRSNTLDAYGYAIAYGVDMIEIDVQQTLDGRYVSFHDSTVDAKTDGSGWRRSRGWSPRPTARSWARRSAWRASRPSASPAAA